LWPYLGYEKIAKERTGQSSFGCRRVNDPENSKGGVVWRSETVKADLAAQKAQPAIQALSWCAFVVRQNFSNCCRKVIDAGTRHDDAVAATVSFFGDAQESPALVFSELHVKMLAFYLQFSRLDDVIHFPLKAPTLPHPFWGMEEKSAEFVQIFCATARRDRRGIPQKARRK
jgi:hypothetical protein